MGLRDYVQKSGFKKVLLGLSGGIDSAITAVIAAQAVGPQNVIGISLPSDISSQHSRDDAAAVAKNLGIQYHTLAIADVVAAAEKTLAPLFTGRPRDIAEENIQARARGLLLMAISNKFGALLLTTGNKSELAVGYCTLYGDTNGGLAVLGDVLKTEVWQIARHINEKAGREIIPNKIIDKKPSAELAPNQFDQDSLPPYEAMDPVLKMYFEQKASPTEIIAAGNDAELVYGILNKVEHPANEFKRRQLPPTLIISKNAIGVGRRRPVTHKYRRAM
jgi:NAD+ synthase (glutamine-hydrolysing)